MCLSCRFLLLLAVFLSVAAPYDQTSSQDSVVLSAAKTELARSYKELRKQSVPPYFLSYEITDSRTVGVAGSFGALVQSDENHHRQVHIDLRAGGYRLDNTRQVRGNFLANFGGPLLQYGDAH